MLRNTLVTIGVTIVLLASTVRAQEPKGQRRGGFGGAGFGRGGFANSPALLLRMPEVQKEIGIRDEQKKELDGLQELLRSTSGGFNFQELQSLGQEERRQRLEEFRKKSQETNRQVDEKLRQILDAKQLERLNQLRLQREGIAAFNRPEIAKQLGLTTEQGDKIRKIQTDGAGGAPGGPGGLPNLQNLSDQERRDFFARMQERREKMQADILAVLTDEQKTKWNELKGKPFDFPTPQGAFGGFGPAGKAGERRRPPSKKKEG
jgi:hypothetical protein